MTLVLHCAVLVVLHPLPKSVQAVPHIMAVGQRAGQEGVVRQLGDDTSSSAQAATRGGGVAGEGPCGVHSGWLSCCCCSVPVIMLLHCHTATPADLT